MSPRNTHNLLSMPASLRALLLNRLSAQPFTPRYSSTSPPPRESLQGLWSTPSITLSPPPRRSAGPGPVLDCEPPPQADLRGASSFFLQQKPSFLYSAVSWRSHQVNYYVPEVIVLGCSNAGKSTFINALLGSDLARSSSRPGLTREMNAYATGPVVRRKVVKNQNVKSSTNKMDLLRSLVLMDTPGYGFNSVKEWGQQIEEYLQRRTMLKGVILLLRSDVPLTGWDAEVLEFLSHLGQKTTIILTRADRCGPAGWVSGAMERYAQIQEALKRPRREMTDGGWTPEICVTAAGMAQGGTLKRGKLKRSPGMNEAGMGGARMAVLRLAGLIPEEVEPSKKRREEVADKEKEKEQPQSAPEVFVGDTVSWDDIPMKGAGR